jgi:leader peptidase (prepilin peptidase)/N-methyltransferase
VAVPEWIWYIFIFAFGCCVGSFLNVVIYRLPRDKSLVKPPSSCPACGKHIRFYDNIPLISWLVLGRKCRYCKGRISPRYFVIELLTGAVFVGLFVLYFHSDLRSSIGSFGQGGWFVYLLHIILLASFIAASAIDLELWVIPMSVCWFATAIGLIGSGAGAYLVDVGRIRQYLLLPSTSDIVLKEVSVACLAAGALIGLIISCLLLVTGFIKRSYESEESHDSAEQGEGTREPQFSHRREICKEIIFLLPIIACSLAGYLIGRNSAAVQSLDFSQHPVVSGLLGSVWGYFVGCGAVWVTRILGTLGFGKEAMGLGDVHLMGAAGAMVGAPFVVAAFFIAPFFGLAWAGVQMFFKKTRQIPYGPFLSLGVLSVMILHDWIFNYWNLIRYH